MILKDCFEHMAKYADDDVLVMTSAGHSSGTWWHVTKDVNRAFYLTASMSLSSMMASGLAVGVPNKRVWAFSGDGAFVMNPGMLFVERRMSLPNLKHFMISNHCYSSTDEVNIPYTDHADYAGMARAVGIKRVYHFNDIAVFKEKFEEAVMEPGHTFMVLEVEKVGTDLRTAQMDGPEVKFRFGRHVEKATGKKIFDGV